MFGNERTKAIGINIYNFIKKYYTRLIAAGLTVYALFPQPVSIEYRACLLLLALAFSDVHKDMVQVGWKKYLISSLPFLIIPILFWKYVPAIWNQIVYWEMGTAPHLFNWNDSFKHIPFNDGAFARVFKPEWLTWYMRFVYGYGFALPVIIPIYRSFLAKDVRKMVSYLLSAHILQFLLIAPFYLSIHLEETWYVLGHPDGMARNLSPEVAATVVVNCFPSMHTSVSFAMLLLALREKGKIYKTTWVIFCSSIIYSTMYLEIHWVLDVLAGMLLAWAAVKLGDFIINKISSIKARKGEGIPSNIDVA